MDDEWQTGVIYYCTETGCLRALLLSNTETKKIAKGLRTGTIIVLNNRMVKGICIPIDRNNRFRLAVPIVYRPPGGVSGYPRAWYRSVS